MCLHDIAPSIIGLFNESPVRLIAHIYCSCVFVSVQLLNHYNFIDCVYAKYASLAEPLHVEFIIFVMQVIIQLLV